MEARCDTDVSAAGYLVAESRSTHVDTPLCRESALTSGSTMKDIFVELDTCPAWERDRSVIWRQYKGTTCNNHLSHSVILRLTCPARLLMSVSVDYRF